MPTVLCIEDDVFYSQILKKQFEAADLHVVWASNGEEGLETAKKEEPDLIILDIAMPKMNGFETLDALKKEKTTKDIPVVMLTNMSTKEDVERCLNAGAAAYFIKVHHTVDEVVRYAKANFFAKL